MSEQGQITFTEEERGFLRDITTTFHDRFVTQRKQIMRACGRVEPTAVREFAAALKEMLRELQSGLRLQWEHVSLLKRVLIKMRLDTANEVEGYSDRAEDAGVLEELDARLDPYRQMFATEWFAISRAISLPRLSDFVPLAYAEELLEIGADPAAIRTERDEKFNTLHGPSFFLGDLEYHRRRCSLRNTHLGVAYIDIDDFKTFNSEFTNEVVDRDVLPRFMRCIEAETYMRGYAYRFGGDEYVVLLPNTDEDQAQGFFRRLQANLAAIE